MKQILISEGKYDVFLLEQFYKEFNKSVDTFLKEEVQKKSDPENQQTNTIRSFIEPRCPDDVLIKSEGSKNYLLTFLSTQIHHLIENIDEVIMVVDLDSDDEEGLENLREKLSDKIEDRHQGSGLEAQIKEPMKTNEYLVVSEAYCYLRGSCRGGFLVIGLKPNLEDIAGIDREGNERKTKEEKISQLLDEEKIYDFLHEVLVNRSNSDL